MVFYYRLFRLDLQEVIDGAGCGLLDLDGIHKLHRTAVFIQLGVYFGRADAEHQCTELYLIKGFVDDTLLEYHLGIELAGAGEDNFSGGQHEMRL